MIKVAEKFKVSGSYMARVCANLNVPRPERGYWAKLAVGKAPDKPSLPELQPGDQISWNQDGESQASSRPRLIAPPRSGPPRKKLLRVVAGVHGLIRNAKGHYDAGYRVDEGQHLRPYKRLLVDVTASSAALDKALGFANDLFNALESAGNRVLISSPAENFTRPHVDEHEQLPKVQRNEHSYNHSHLWWPERPTVVYVDSVAFGLAIIEMSESVVLRYVNGKYIRESDYKPKTSARYVDHNWTTTKDIPCGRLRLVVYAPYRGVSWSISFQESKDRTLTTDIPKMVKSIENSTELLMAKVKEEEGQAELRRQEWAAQEERRRHEDDRRRVAQSINESREQLAKVIEDWARVVSLEQFFSGVQSRAQDLPEEQRQEVLKRLALAREFVGTQDPLEFFRSWKTPVEKYLPLSMQQAAAKQD
jgi:hypothetical protein